MLSHLEGFTQDQILDGVTQGELYDQVVRESVEQFMDGFNNTIMVYGTSGSGKTYTLCGPDVLPGDLAADLDDEAVSADIQEQYGVLPRLIGQVIQQYDAEIEQNEQDVDKQHNLKFNFKISFFEMFQDELNNLLGEDGNWERVNFYEQSCQPIEIEDNLNTIFSHLARG